MSNPGTNKTHSQSTNAHQVREHVHAHITIVGLTIIYIDGSYIPSRNNVLPVAKAYMWFAFVHTNWTMVHVFICKHMELIK